MLHKKITVIGLFLLLVMAACSPAITENEGDDLSPTKEVVLQPANEEPEVEEKPDPTAVPTAEPSVVEEEPASNDAEQVAELPLLPQLPPSQGGGVGGGGFGGGGGNVTAEASVQTSESMIVDDENFEPFNPFENTNFVLNISLDTDVSAATVWQQPAIYPDPQAAYQMAEKLGFPLPLYQEVLPPNAREDVELMGNGIYRLPFIAIRNGEWLTLMSGSAFYENRGAFNRIEQLDPLPFDQARSLAEQQIAVWGGLNFEYEIVDQGFGNIAVQRLINGQRLDYPEMYFQFDSNGQLLYASYNVLSDLTALGDYPLVSPAAAFEKIKGGVIENDVWFSYQFDPAFAVEPAVVPIEGDFDYQFWQRTYEPGDPINMVGYPQIYLPVQADGLPLVIMDQFTVIGPQELFIDLIADRPFQIMVDGVVGADGRTIEMQSWQAAEDLEPLFLEGTLFQEDMGMVLQTVDERTYMLLDVPADVEHGLEVYVFGWQASESDLFPFPVLDWINIDKRIEFPDDGEIVFPTEPDITDLYDPQIAEVKIDEVTLTYLYVAQWPQFEENVEYVQPEYDMPPVLLQPFWQFSGTNDKGEGMMFSVPAVDPAYFASQ